MLSKRRITSHICMWTLVGAGVVLAFIFIPYGILLYKNINVSFVAIFLFVFLIYHLLSAFWKRGKFHLASSGYSSQEMKKMVELGVYGKCIHPTCTALAILGWIIFFLIPDFIIFISVSWLTAVIIFWIRAEKSFFLGKKSKFETEDPNVA